MISKAWLNSFWVIAGKGQKDEKLISRTWLRQVEPPYLAGHGIAFTLKKWSLRIGVCTPLYEEVNLYDEADVALHNLPRYELDTETKEISAWDSSETETQNDQDETGSQEHSEQSIVLDMSPPESYTTGQKPASDNSLTLSSQHVPMGTSTHSQRLCSCSTQ